MSNSAAFRLMADRIDHNQGSGFAGAAVIVPPPMEGATNIEILILDPAADPAQFWSTIMSRAQMVLQDLEFRQKRQQQLGIR